MDERQFAGIIMFLVAGFGFIVNAIVVYSIPQVSFLAKSFFGRVARVQAFSGAFHGAIFAFLTAPILYFDISFLARRDVTVYFVFALESCYEISTYGHVLLSSNRFIVLFFSLKSCPFLVPAWLKLLLIAVPLLISEFVLVLSYFFEMCDAYLETAVWGYIYAPDPRCIDFRMHTSFSRYATMLIIVAILDVACIIKKSRTNANRSRSAAANIEHRLLYQACAQASIFLADIISAFVILPQFTSNQWIQFFLATIVWVVAMGADGLMIFLFNKEVRHVVFGNVRCEDVESKDNNISQIFRRIPTVTVSNAT